MPPRFGSTPPPATSWEDRKVDKAKTGFLIFILLIVLLFSGCVKPSQSAIMHARVRAAGEMADKIEVYTRTRSRLNLKKIYKKKSPEYKRLVADLISALEPEQRYRHLVVADRRIVFKNKGRKLLRIHFASEDNSFAVLGIDGVFLLPVSGRKLVE